MKKYHHKPTFGVKSGSKSWTPYVEDRNSQDPPVNVLEMYSSHPTPAEKMGIHVAKKPEVDGGVFVFLARWSKQRMSTGGRRSAGYRER